jgi:hypothetical protein
VKALDNYNDDDTMIEYRLAYLAICLQNNDTGQRLRDGLSRTVEIDPEYIQFGCADWFWRRHPNSYVVQTEPQRFRNQDTAMVRIKEALHLQSVRDRMFDRIREIIAPKP